MWAADASRFGLRAVQVDDDERPKLFSDIQHVERGRPQMLPSRRGASMLILLSSFLFLSCTITVYYTASSASSPRRGVLFQQHGHDDDHDGENSRSRTPLRMITSSISNNRRTGAGALYLYRRRGNTSTRRARKLEGKDYKVGLDFFIAGYPKTGTSAMMEYLDSSDELKIVSNHKEDVERLTEFGINHEDDVERLFDRIEEEYFDSDSDKDEKYGIKSPGALSGKGMGGHTIELLEEYNPIGTETKIIIGLRHPVRWFESFYNYRHGYEPGSPPTTALIGETSFHGVSTDRARFEMGIMQLGKVPLRPEDEEWIIDHRNYNVIDGGTPNKVFLYLTEQLGDKDKERHGVFLDTLSSFLELNEPFTVDYDVPKRNVKRHKRVDICAPEHDEVRDVLVENGKKTAEWFRANNVAEMEGFVLPNKEHFLTIVDTFGTDPCSEEAWISL